MDKSRYLSLLGLKGSPTLDEIRRAYRRKARLFHPDLNHSPDASARFIEVTEAYEYLTHHQEEKEAEYDRRQEAYQEWVNYRQKQARERAEKYARVKYSQFKSSGYYKASATVEKSRIIYNLAISVFIIIAAVYGYIYRLGMVDEGFEKPTIAGFISLLVIGFLFMSVSILYLAAYIQIHKARRNLGNEKN
ncbi:MAG: DnaJ domain-containing protein [Bacteroidales bacterium]